MPENKLEHGIVKKKINCLKNKVLTFTNKYFVKWKFLNSLLVIPLEKDGKMYLHISQVCRDGTRVIRRTFLIEHLVDENFEVISGRKRELFSMRSP